MAFFLELEDVENLAKLNPDSFFIPSELERKSQKIGDSVRLHFLLDKPSNNEPQAERMWVTITRQDGPLPLYKGMLENAPVYISNLQIGDEIEFLPCHIARVIIKKSDPRWIDSYEQKALVSKMCLKNGAIVRFMYREKADRKQDSGWRMFSGNETEEYNDDSSNIAIVDIGWLLDRDPTLLEPLKEGIGAAFERPAQNISWDRIADWNLMQ